MTSAKKHLAHARRIRLTLQESEAASTNWFIDGRGPSQLLMKPRWLGGPIEAKASMRSHKTLHFTALISRRASWWPTECNALCLKTGHLRGSWAKWQARAW